MTSVSDPPRKVHPACSSSRRSWWWLYTSPLKTSVYRVDEERIGWCPCAERSTMASRRKPNAMPAAGSAHVPLSSGPR
jgi:hypothetical protein